jgi:endonuclease G
MGLNLLHDNQARIASWVSYVLTRERTLACAARIDNFSPDPLLRQRSRAETSDYRRSGFDMGHMAPNADQSWHPTVQVESFYLSNVAPQLASVNRGLWRELETIVRGWAFERHSITVYVGSVYAPGAATIGANRVVVPSAFYKIVVDNHSRQSLAFLFPHRAGLGDHISSVQTSVAQIQAATGITFPVPDNPNVVHPLWSYNTRALARARSEACRN